MNCEIVQKHEYQDIYRLCYGVLVIVNKYKSGNKRLHWGYAKDYKKKLQKIDGLKNCHMFKEDIVIHSYGGETETINKGTVILENHVIIPIVDKNEFFYELKTTGSSFSGDLREFYHLLNMAKQIIDSY